MKDYNTDDITVTFMGQEITAPKPKNCFTKLKHSIVSKCILLLHLFLRSFEFLLLATLHYVFLAFVYITILIARLNGQSLKFSKITKEPINIGFVMRKRKYTIDVCSL